MSETRVEKILVVSRDWPESAPDTDLGILAQSVDADEKKPLQKRYLR